jgi:hypothetical protein
MIPADKDDRSVVNTFIYQARLAWHYGAAHASLSAFDRRLGPRLQLYLA